MNPTSRPFTLLALAALSALLTAGCALTSKSDPLAPRYFSPEKPSETRRASSAPTGAALELRLGHITSTAHLDERIIYRDSDRELGYYMERRWTEAPEQYLKRRLARVLFEERGVRQVVGGPAPTLDVELVAFEEIRGDAPVARMEVTVRLHDQRIVRWEQTLTTTQSIPGTRGDRAAAAVDALGAALVTLVDRIADRIVTELSVPAAGTGGPDAGSPPPPATRVEVR